MDGPCVGKKRNVSCPSSEGKCAEEEETPEECDRAAAAPPTQHLREQPQCSGWSQQTLQLRAQREGLQEVVMSSGPAGTSDQT